MSATPAPAPRAGAAPASSPSQSLRALLEETSAQQRTLSLDDAIAILVPLCSDLKARHARGERLFVHASALMRGPDGALALAPQLATMPANPRDKAALAPELVKSGQPGDARSSVFAVGAMLYEMVTGAPVGPGLRRPRDVNPRLPEGLELLMGKALVADPAHRPDDLGALAAALHQLAPAKSLPPPAADISRLDGYGDFQVDVRMSLLPPIEVQFSIPPSNPAAVEAAPLSQPAPVSQSAVQGADIAQVVAAAKRDPTRHLATLKARLEADQRPRYVVNKQRMDHGPFSAVELLQQIASHTFAGEDILRDELTGVAKTIDEWEEFEPFADHARRHRQIAQEKKEVAKVEKAEKKAGVAKVVISAVVAVSLLGVGVAFVVKKVGERKDGSDLSDDPSAIDLSGGGALKGGKKAGGGGGKAGGGGGGGGFPAGMSYEAALNSNNQEITMGAKSGPDLSDGQLSAPMRNASFISGCGAPDSMKVTVKVAIKNGRAVGVSVYPSPPSPGVASCVDRHVRGLSWPVSAKMDSFTTTY